MNLANVPKELRDVKQWSISYNKDQLKRPHHSHYQPDGALGADEADRLAGDLLLCGFYTTSSDPYILLDIDHVDDPNNPWDSIPDSVRSFMLARQTYWESSPSGKGLRGVLKLTSAEIKEELQTKRALLISSNGDSSDEAEAHFGPPWMTITGNKTTFSVDEIATVTIDELKEVFNVKYKSEVVSMQEVVESNEPLPAVSQDHIPSMLSVKQALSALPLDRNPRVQRAYQNVFNQEYQHYDFWMKVMMAVHNYATVSGKTMECLTLVDEWSHADDAYVNSEDVFNHWKSLSNKETQVTYKTLFKLMNEATLVWPVPRKQTKDEKEAQIGLKPNISAYDNFRKVITFFDIKFYRSELSAKGMFSVYLTGDRDIMDKFFLSYATDVEFDKYYGPFTRDLLVPCFNAFLQRLGFVGLGHQRTREFLGNILSHSHGTINLIKEYIETPLHELPMKYRENIENAHESGILQLFECLQIEFVSKDRERELNLYRKYYLAWLMGLLRNLYTPSEEANINNCVLVLTGKEQIRKTSHFKYLLPSFLKKYVVFTPHGFDKSDSMRDLAKIARSNLIVVWDEIEQFLNTQTESNFKKVIDNNPQTIIDKYKTEEETVTPISIYGATSNQREFKLGDQGSRRMFIIPVSWVDTDKMKTLCWHTIFRELVGFLKTAFDKGTTPWLLTEEELELQLSLHNRFKAKTDFDLLFEEIFDTSVPVEYVAGGIKGISSVQNDKSGQLKTTKDIQLMLQKYDENMTYIKRPVLVRALERFCGRYTRTERKSKQLESPKCTITKGLMQQSIHKKWLLPPLTAEAHKVLYVFERQ